MVSRRRKESTEDSGPRRRPATTPDGREKQLISYAVDLAEKQLREGSASAQVITHYLKMGSVREQLERDRLAGENELLTAKIEAAGTTKRIEEMYAKALDAMRSYTGQESLRNDDEFDD